MLRRLGAFTVVGEANNGLDAVALAAQLQPDVVLMDLSLPGLNGLEATRRITRQLPDTVVVMLTFMDDEANLVEALHAGARGYILKGADPEQVLADLRRATAGETPISGSLTMKLIGSLALRHRLPASGAAISLDDHERNLVALVAAGKSNVEVARALHMPLNTEKRHLSRLFKKLALHSRSELVALAAEGGKTPS